MPSLLDHWHQHLFSALHARSLLYNACWEDPALDREALQLGPSDRVLVITSGGCNALDYVLAGAGSVVAVDMNPRQTALLELKLASLRTLEFEDHWQLFGAGHHPQFRTLYRDRLRPVLSLASRRCWDRQQDWFEEDAGGLYLRGLSGTVARGFRAWTAVDRGLRKGVEALLASRSLDEQRDAYDRLIRPRLSHGVLHWALRRRWFACLCGVPALQREEVERAGGDMATFVRESFDRVFRTVDLSTNYFYQVYLRGGYQPDCCPTYLTVAGWRTFHDGAWARVTPVTDTISGHLEADRRPFSRFVLLDHLDWMADRRPDLVAEEWAWILRRSTPSARAIWRSAHPEPRWMAGHAIDGLPLARHWRLERALAAQLHPLDRVGTYAGFHIAALERAA